MVEPEKVKVAYTDDKATVIGLGELDLYYISQFDKALTDAVSSNKSVVVDLTGATFIDSAILQSIIKHGKTIFNRGDRLKILVTSGSHPEFVLETVGFSIIVDIVSVEPEGSD